MRLAHIFDDTATSDESWEVSGERVDDKVILLFPLNIYWLGRSEKRG